MFSYIGPMLFILLLELVVDQSYHGKRPKHGKVNKESGLTFQCDTIFIYIAEGSLFHLSKCWNIVST